jgi:hypothetical protein
MSSNNLKIAWAVDKIGLEEILTVKGFYTGLCHTAGNRTSTADYLHELPEAQSRHCGIESAAHKSGRKNSHQVAWFEVLVG